MLVLAVGGCATNPATGERQLALVSEPQEVALGRQAAAQVQQTVGFVDDRALQRYVQQVGRGLAAGSERPELPWTFAVVDDPGLNAFALPGGFIFITRGLMGLLTTEAELASILGHEIGHVTARHSVEQISRAQLAQLGLGLGGVLFPQLQSLSSIAGAGLQLLFLKYGRDDERQADRLGFGYMREQGYDVSEFPDVFVALERASDASSSSLPGWLSTHPTTAERIRTAEEYVAATPPRSTARVGREVYLQHIDGLVYGPDPRNGFFRDGVFYQPALDVQISFPAGWQGQNLARSVVAAPPDAPAAIELTIVNAPSPARALDLFQQSTGAQLAVATPNTLRGAQALVAPFRAATDNGVVIDGYVATLEHRGVTYQIVGYAAVDAAPAFRRVILSCIESFGAISNPRLRSVSPQRIDVVRLRQPRTLADFARTFRSAVPLDRLAVLNATAPTTQFAAGTLVKRVV